METVLITGGTGFIGSALSKVLLERDYEVIILSRNPPANSHRTEKLQYAQWNIQEQTIDAAAITTADHIIHLAGANVGEKRWTEKRKKEIIESRAKSSDLLVKALKENKNQVMSVISASATGWYGPDPEIPNATPFTEDDDWYDDFLGQTCKAWEENIQPVTTLSKRLVRLRTGIVINDSGGAIDQFRKPLQFGIAPILGNGKQSMSWIHLDDLVRLYIYSIENEKLNGAYNAVAPFPVTNRNFVLKLAKEVKGKFYIPVYVPSFILRLMLGEMTVEVLKSTTVSCEKIQKAGFKFLYPSIVAAIRKQQVH
jgi:uncharacterized protein (TIGR01777 family)